MIREELIQLLITLKKQSRNSKNGTFVDGIKPSSFVFVINSAIKTLKDESYTLWKESYEVEADKNDRLQKQIEALRQDLWWIPVSERLPEEEYDVLVCNENGDIEIARGSYSTELKNEFIWYISSWRFGKVIAWMPLPPSYREEVRYEND